MPGEQPESRPLFLELTVTHRALPLWEFLHSRKERHLELELQPYEADGPQYAFLTISDGTDGPAVEREVERDPSVGDVVTLGPIGDAHVCRVELRNEVPLLPSTAAEVGIRTLSIESDPDEGWRLQMHVPSRESLEHLRRHYHDNDITFHIKRLHRVRRSDEGHEMHLSPGQYDALVTAYNYGYFDVPRGITQGELAEKLDVSRSAVSQRIRRAVGKLIKLTLVR